MTIEQKARAYDEALAKAKEVYQRGYYISGDIEIIFPELAESEDERIRKRISQALHGDVLDMDEIVKADAWLEKQCKCETDCPQNHQDVNHPNGCITMEDFSGGEGFYKLNIEYLNKRQVEEIEEIVRTWNKDVDCELCTSKEHCISIEKQSEQNITDKAEPKFKVGDKVLWKYDKSDVRTIAKISDYGTYWIECPGCGSGWWTDDELEPYVESDWTEEDERLFNSIYNTLEGIAPLSYKKELDWLKSIKERMQ